MQKLVQLAVIAIVALLTAIAAAAPEVYFPTRLYVSGALFHEPRGEEFGLMGRTGFPVEAWYFDNMCIVSRTTPAVMRGSVEPPRLVYAYWYGKTAPDGDFWFQQWVSPGANPVEVRMEHHLPRDAQMVNPLWHLLQYRALSQEKRETVIAEKDQPATGTLVRLHDPPTKSGDVTALYNVDFLIVDDRVVSSSYAVDTRYVKPSAERRDNVMLVQQTVASQFDEKFPTVPRKLQRMSSGHYLFGDTTFEVDRVDRILTDVSPEAVLNHLTQGLQRVHKQGPRGSDDAAKTDLVLEDLEDGSRVRLEELRRNKFLVVLTWASWAPSALWDGSIGKQEPYGLIGRLKAEYDRFKDSPDVEFVGVSLDVDRDAARAFAAKHQMPWRNLIAPGKVRSEVAATLGLGEVPNVTLMKPEDGESRVWAPEYVLGSQPHIVGSSSPLERLVEEKHAIAAAGGRARYLLKKPTISILEGFETCEVLELTGDHMGELMMGANVPLLPPPPPAGATWQIPPPPVLSVQRTPNPEDLPTSIGVLVKKYPLTKRAQVKSRRSAVAVAKLLVDDTMVKGHGGEEALPAPKRAIVLKRGEDVLSLVYDGMLEIYLNDERVAWLMLTEAGSERFEELYRWLARDAGE